MVKQTEQNNLVANNEEEIKVIAIKLPFDLQERLLSFPFLHTIRDQYPLADIHFITPKKQVEVLNLLPFKAFYHEIDEDEITNIFDVHRYCVTVNIYNCDLFISLTNSFVDACLGFGLKAKKRLGFMDGWKSLVLNLKVNRPVGHHYSEDFIALYKTLVGHDLSSKLKVMSRELTPVISQWEDLPYLAINLSPIRQAAIEEELVELINYFENKRIILFSSDDQDKVQLLIEPFMAKLSKKNIYEHYFHKSWIELGKMLAFSRGVITFNGPCANLSAYVGARTVILFDSEDPQKTGPLYFLAESLMLNVNDPTLSKKVSASGSIQVRKQFDMNEVFGKIFVFFKMIIQ